MTGNAQRYHVFLSHAHPDAGAVEQLAELLHDNAKVRVWLDRWVLVPGEGWLQHMAKALYEAETCAVCIGTQTPQGWFREEIDRALNRQVQDKTFRVIPVLLPNCDRSIVDNFLELRTWVDFSGGLNDNYAFSVLSSGIKGTAPPKRRDVEAAKPPPLILHKVREKLSLIRDLELDGLVDRQVVLDAQKELINELIKA